MRKWPLSIPATKDLFQRTLGKLLSDVVEHKWELPCEQMISCSLIALSSVRRLLGPGQAGCHSTCISRVDERVAKLPVTEAISQSGRKERDSSFDLTLRTPTTPNYLLFLIHNLGWLDRTLMRKRGVSFCTGRNEQ